jgi:hypothetical protein
MDEGSVLFPYILVSFDVIIIGSVGLKTCSATNLTVSKYIIPMVVFSQHAVQCYYPSQTLSNYRTFIAALHLLPILGMMYQFECSTLVGNN